jgi:hypothetical protein
MTDTLTDELAQKTKWTPQPWSLDDELSVYGWLNVQVAATKPFDPMTGEQDANAHLIAAAPDLYGALAYFVDRYVAMINSGDCGSWNPENDDEVVMARGALAKARGEQS